MIVAETKWRICHDWNSDNVRETLKLKAERISLGNTPRKVKAENIATTVQ